MDFDVWFRTGTFLVAVIGGAKIIYDVYSGRVGKVRDEYRFAKEFLFDLKGGDLHPFLKDKGFHAISGNQEIQAEEAEYLLDLRSPVKALRDFSLGRDYIELSKESPRHFIRFKKKYCNPWSRRWRKGLYVVLYFVLAMTAFLPLIFYKWFGGASSALAYFFIFAMIFGVPAVALLMTGVRLYRAEELEKNQARHKDIIVAMTK